MEYFDMSHQGKACFNEEPFSFELDILPFVYLDNRKPRLPRKSSKRYELMKDTRYYFIEVFSEINTISQSFKFKVNIEVKCGSDRLGSADLDNYCKAILDGVTTTGKVWFDDRQVDEISIKRIYTANKYSSINLQIEKV